MSLFFINQTLFILSSPYNSQSKQVPHHVNHSTVATSVKSFLPLVQEGNSCFVSKDGIAHGTLLCLLPGPKAPIHITIISFDFDIQCLLFTRIFSLRGFGLTRLGKIINIKKK